MNRLVNSKVGKMKNQSNSLLALIAVSMLLLMPLPGEAENINIDFGNTTGISQSLSDAFAGAANQPGTWNRIVDFDGSNVFDINGIPTDVNYSISAGYMHGWQGGGIPQGNILVNDNFFTYVFQGYTWSVSFTGIDSGIYDVYYYGPRNDHVVTGNFLVNGVLANSIDGNEYNGSFVKGIHYNNIHTIVDESGILLLSSIDIGSPIDPDIQGLAGLQITAVPIAPEPVTIILEGFDDSSGFTISGGSAAHWGISSLTGTTFTQGGSQDGKIFYGSFAKDYFDTSYDLSIQSLMTISIPDLTGYTNLTLTVSLAAAERIWEPTHRDSLHIINGIEGGDCVGGAGCMPVTGAIDSFLPSSYPDFLRSTVHSNALGLQFQDFEYSIDSSLESLTFAFSSTDYPEIIGIDSVRITGDPLSEPAVIWAVEYRWGDPAPGYSFVDWPIFEGWMEVLIENRGDGDAFNVTATITDWSDNTTVTDPDVTVGDVPAGSSAWSGDTFTTTVDMDNPGDPSEGIYWRIEYDDENGIHHVIENVPEFPPGEGPCD